MNLTIKNIPAEVYEELKALAKAEGRSLNSQVLHQLGLDAEEARRRRKMREARPALERFLKTLPKMKSSVPLIRADRSR